MCTFVKCGRELVGSNLDGISDGLERNVMGQFDIGVFLNVWSGVAYKNHVVGNWIGVDAGGSPVGGESASRSIGIRSSRTSAQPDPLQRHWRLVAAARSIGTGSGQNCIAGNITGLQHEGTEVDLFAENNYWGAADGPSGVGPGSGDPIVELARVPSTTTPG